ncbi:hypothetical protein NDU88_004005 [Pleurodeles waltl]|uniref:Uncharacterized protein n=1 Tax=Pleurodeles waltl TaxID=8319 RepID=A0AAV7KX56_PLEWA|nr:hypothetical protein NDU88_004005 [Pleurodeles waltl]
MHAGTPDSRVHSWLVGVAVEQPARLGCDTPCSKTARRDRRGTGHFQQAWRCEGVALDHCTAHLMTSGAGDTRRPEAAVAGSVSQARARVAQSKER